MLLAAFACTGVSFADASAVSAAIRDLVRGAERSDAVVVDRRPNAAGPRFYAARDYRPAWSDPRDVSTLAAAIRASADHGLKPTDYGLAEIERMGAAPPADAQRAAQRELLLTTAAATLVRHLRYGKVDPAALDPDWNVTVKTDGVDLVAALGAALDTGRLASFLEFAQVRHPYYATLRSALRSHREIASTGGWPSVPGGAALKPGTTDPRVPALRSRLRFGGDYTGIETGDANVFDADLEAAVKTFQSRHGLDADGIVGAATLAALNVPVATRIDQVRVNLERARWVLHDIEGDMVVVNIAGFYAMLVRGGEEAWQERVIVGRRYHRTPVFRGTMNHLVFNPDWTVPASIIASEIAPEMMKDPGYVDSRDFYLVGRQGERLDPRQVDWARVAESGPYFDVVQRPGPGNALGRVKFMFPNAHAVYLHDTPSRGLFASTERAFSHGCIRVNNPLELATLLLGDHPDWNRQAIEQVVAEGTTTRVNLARNLPVLLLYWTVDPDPDGSVRFYPDIYERDAAVLRALEAPAAPGRQ